MSHIHIRAHLQEQFFVGIQKAQVLVRALGEGCGVLKEDVAFARAVKAFFKTLFPRMLQALTFRSFVRTRKSTLASVGNPDGFLAVRLKSLISAECLLSLSCIDDVLGPLALSTDFFCTSVIAGSIRRAGWCCSRTEIILFSRGEKSYRVDEIIAYEVTAWASD